MNTATLKSLDALMAALAPVIEQHISRRLEPLQKMVADLEAKNAALEMKLGPLTEFRHVGVWNAQQEYAPQNVVTFDGNLFKCVIAGTKERPGTSHDWQMIVRKGKDASSLNGKDHSQ
jgi:hypothetical protein